MWLYFNCSIAFQFQIKNDGVAQRLLSACCEVKRNITLLFVDVPAVYLYIFLLVYMFILLVFEVFVNKPFVCPLLSPLCDELLEKRKIWVAAQVLQCTCMSELLCHFYLHLLGC